jgi:hypothetical protein
MRHVDALDALVNGVGEEKYAESEWPHPRRIAGRDYFFFFFAAFFVAKSLTPLPL